MEAALSMLCVPPSARVACLVCFSCTLLREIEGVVCVVVPGPNRWGVLVQITFNMNPGKLKTLCAAVILVNPFAKFAITMEPVALGARHAATRALKVQETYWFRHAPKFAILPPRGQQNARKVCFVDGFDSG